MITDTDVQIEQNKKVRKGSKEPGRFVVIFHNDDVTPMEFVMQLLETIFHHGEQQARELTIKVHQEGRAIVGVYTWEVAEQKALESVTLARNNGFPLSVSVDQE